MGRIPDRWRPGNTPRGFMARRFGQKNKSIGQTSSSPPTKTVGRLHPNTFYLLSRWKPYTPIGKVIQGTRFIAFKTPLNESICEELRPADRFTPLDLMKLCPEVGLVVDLTNTNRYYDKLDFMRSGVDYEKIMCPGQAIPPNEHIRRFFKIVDEFLRIHPDDGSLIGVHCTHGVNRTAYFIARYMIEQMNFPAGKAIEYIELARGYKIERPNYVGELLGYRAKLTDMEAGRGKEDTKELDRSRGSKNRSRMWR